MCCLVLNDLIYQKPIRCRAASCVSLLLCKLFNKTVPLTVPVRGTRNAIAILAQESLPCPLVTKIQSIEVSKQNVGISLRVGLSTTIFFEQKRIFAAIPVAPVRGTRNGIGAGAIIFILTSPTVPAIRCKYGTAPIHKCLTGLSATIRQLVSS